MLELSTDPHALCDLLQVKMSGLYNQLAKAV